MVHVFRLGPMPFEGRDELVFVAGDDEGVLDVVVAEDDDAGLAEIARRHSRRALTVDPALSVAARRHHLRTAPLSEDALVLRAMMSLSLLLGLDHCDESFRVLPPLLGAAARFASAAPWARFGSGTVLRVQLEGRTYEGAVLGELGESFGLVLYPEPGSVERISEAGLDAHQLLSIPCLALDLEHEPEFALQAIEEIGFPVLPMIMKVGPAGPVRPTAMDIALLTAACDAVVALGCHDSRGESLAEGPGGRVVRAKASLSRPAPFVPHVIRGGPEPEERPTQPRALRRLDARLVEDVLGFADRHWPGWVADTSARTIGPASEGDVLGQFSLPWLAYSADTPAGDSAASLFLAERESTLSSDEAGWLAAQVASWLSVWEVLEVHPNDGLVLLDLLTGARASVREVEGSRLLLPRSALLARVVTYDGLTILAGAHPEVLDPRTADGVLAKLRRKLHLGIGPLPRSQVDVEIVGATLATEWTRVGAAARRSYRRPLAPTNSDGEPLLWTQDYYAIDPAAPLEVLARLSRLPGASVERGEGTSATISLLRPGHARHPEWDSTLVATLRFTPGELRVETCSVLRADTLRAELGRTLGALGRFRLRVHPTRPLDGDGCDAPPDVARARAAREAEGSSASVREGYRRWLATPSAELEGKTPREAIATAARRRVVHLLVKEIEHRSPKDEVGPWLRAELGLGDDGALLGAPRRR